MPEMIPSIGRIGVLATVLMVVAAAANQPSAIAAPGIATPGAAILGPATMAANPGLTVAATAGQASGTTAPDVAVPGVAIPRPGTMAANPGLTVAAALDQPAGSGAASRNLTVACLASGDGYFRARLAGAIDSTIDWPNSGTRCQGESKNEPPGVRMSFQRDPGSNPDLLFVFGLTGVRRGEAAREVRANLTVIVQGTNRIYGTLGDSRCTVDTLTQRPMPTVQSFRIEARGFCTQPAHALHGNGAVLVSTFEFAGVVNYAENQDAGDSAVAPAQALRKGPATPNAVALAPGPGTEQQSRAQADLE